MVITIITMIFTCSITWHVPTLLSLHTLSIEVSTKVSSIIQNQTRAFNYTSLVTTLTARVESITVGELYSQLLNFETHMVKALVCFWIIDETLVLTSILSACRLNEVGTCQVMEQVMIMVMMVMTTR